MILILPPECDHLTARMTTRPDGSKVVEVARPEKFPTGVEGKPGVESRLDVLGRYAGRHIAFPE